MFARIKQSGARAYLQVVVNERVRCCGFERGPLPVRQRVIATLGRVDHMTPEEQRAACDEITVALVNVLPTRRTRRSRLMLSTDNDVDREALALQGYGLKGGHS